MSTIQDWFKEHGITEVEAITPDMTGIARGKIMPAHKYVEEEGIRLPEALFIQTVTGEYPEDGGITDPAESDMLLKADPSTVRLVPWVGEPTALIIHDCFYHDGRPVDLSPRYVLRKVLKLYEEKGWVPVVAPELEFFLIKPNTNADNPLEPPIGRSGRAETGRQSYSIDAVNEFDPVFEDLYDYCDAQRIGIDTLIHEGGAAQMEINLNHGDPMELADQAFLFKRTLRETALRHNIYATFMAKPMEREPGSSMHLHQSIVDAKTGNNIFSDDNGDATPLFYSHIAGLQNYLPMAMAFLAPNVNSYRRVTRFHASPINMQWGYDNRTAGLRVPYSSADSRRVENRLAGADANPYLAIAVSLACGYLGMMEKLTPSAPFEGNAHKLPYSLPRHFSDALQMLEDCAELRELLGERFCKAYGLVKQEEYETYFQVISSWEREHLLLNV